MAYLLTVIALLFVGCSQALLLNTPQETAFIARPTSIAAHIAQTTAPSSPELVKRALGKRDSSFTQTCGYFDPNSSYVCDPSSYCGYGSSNFGCWGYNFTASTYENYAENTVCFDAAQFTSTCSEAGSCSYGTAWCNNPADAATECVTLVLTGRGNYTAFECGSTASLRYGYFKGLDSGSTGNSSSFATSTGQISSVTVLQPTTVTAFRTKTATATTVYTVTASNGAELNAKPDSGTVMLSTIFGLIALLLSI